MAIISVKSIEKAIKIMMDILEKLDDGGIYDTKKYRYIVDQSDGEIYRIEKDLLGTVIS